MFLKNIFKKLLYEIMYLDENKDMYINSPRSERTHTGQVEKSSTRPWLGLKAAVKWSFSLLVQYGFVHLEKH